MGKERKLLQISFSQRWHVGVFYIVYNNGKKAISTPPTLRGKLENLKVCAPKQFHIKHDKYADQEEPYIPSSSENNKSADMALSRMIVDAEGGVV